MHGKSITGTFWAHLFGRPCRSNGTKIHLDAALGSPRWQPRKTIQYNIILTDVYKKWRNKYSNSALKWCRTRKENLSTLSSCFWLMTWISCPNKFIQYHHPSPLNVTFSKSPYLTAHLKINYEPGRISEKVQARIQDRHNV